MMRVMEAKSVKKMSLIGLSYGGFVGYSMAAQFKEAIERVVICGAGVCLEEKDLEKGLFKVSHIEDAASILLPQTPEKLRELLSYTFYKPPRGLPSCLLNDFIQVSCLDITFSLWCFLLFRIIQNVRLQISQNLISCYYYYCYWLLDIFIL